MDSQEEAAHRRLERLRHAHERVIAMINATANFEREAIRPPFYLNGGALVVYIALYGATSAAEHAAKLDRRLALVAIGLWGIGILAASLAVYFGFRSQWAFRRHRGDEVDAEEARERREMETAGASAERARIDGRLGSRDRTCAVWAGAISLLTFVCGAIAAMASLP